jgi:hypothetical protein
MKMNGGVGIYLHTFLMSALDGSGWSASPTGYFSAGVRTHATHWAGGEIIKALIRTKTSALLYLTINITTDFPVLHG